MLDTSALLAYARLSGIAVGELVAMVEEDGGAALVGIPAACFLSAYAAVESNDRTRLVDLATKIDGVTAIQPILGTDTIEVAELQSRLTGSGAAHAIVEVRKRGALLATYEGDSARGELPDDTVLDL